MLDIDDAKFPPPMPESTASAWNTQSGVSCDMSANPVPAAGIMSSAVVKKIVFRPPAMRIRKLLGILSVAPVSPAIADRVNSSPVVKGNPRLSI